MLEKQDDNYGNQFEQRLLPTKNNLSYNYFD